MLLNMMFSRHKATSKLFMGHKGSGKSTEIVNISDKLKDKYEIITFSIAQEIEIMGIEYIDVIFVIMSQIIDFLEKNDNIKVNKKLVEELTSYWTKEEVFEKIISDETDFEAGGKAGLSLLKKII